MKNKSFLLCLLLCAALLLLLLLLFPLYAGRDSLKELSFSEAGPEDIAQAEISARWEEKEFSMQETAFFEELLSLFGEIELRPLLLPSNGYKIEKAGAYWFYFEMENGWQVIFKIMDGKMILQADYAGKAFWRNYSITEGAELLPEILALLEKYSQEQAISEQPPVDIGEEALDSAADSLEEIAEVESRSPLLREKLAAGLASADALEGYAWERVQRDLSYLGKIKPELQFLDAEISLEKTDSFTEFYPDREIEGWLFSSRIQTDPVPEPDTGLPALDEAGWLSNDIGLGPCWLIVENAGGERSVLGHCFPEGEDIGLPSCITAALIHRDLEAGLDVSALLLRDLAYSIRHDPIPNAPGFIFRVPEKCPNAKADLQIRVFGSKDGTETELSGEIFCVSDSLPRWKAGNYYRLPCVVEEYDGLRMELSLPGPDGQQVELEIDLLARAGEISPEQP